MCKSVIVSAVAVMLAFASILHATDEQTVVVPIGDKPCEVDGKGNGAGYGEGHFWFRHQGGCDWPCEDWREDQG